MNIQRSWKCVNNFSKAKEEIVNHVIRIYYKGNQEYFVVDVLKYNPKTCKHLVIYKTDTEKIQEDLSKEKWMLLEQTSYQITIYKKNRRRCSLAVKKKNISRTNQQQYELLLNN